MTKRDKDRLVGVHPDARAAYEDLGEAIAALGCEIFVVEGLRSQARQQALYAKGRTDRSGPIVTYADGVKTPSTHQLGLAIDVAFVDDPRTPKDETWDVTMPWDLLGRMWKHLGGKWGGDFKRLKDLGHLEWTGHKG